MLLPAPLRLLNAKDLALVNFEAHIFQSPEFLNLFARHHLSPTGEVDCLAGKVTGLISDDIAQRRIALVALAATLMLDNITLGQIFDGNSCL